MARRRKHVPLNVFLNSRFVGQLNREANGAIDFQYDSSWLEWEYAFPVSLSLPLREDRYVGAPVVAVFDNLLPDSASIRRRVAERVGADGVDAYSLLTAVGRDCVGALQFLPDGQDPDPAGTIDGRSVDNDEIARLLNNLASAPLGLDSDQDFRISIAGAQEKTAFLFWEGRWCKPHGTTATTHILKPQIGRIPNGIDLSDSIENEYLCLKLTAELGIPSANVEIGEFAGKRALVVERFDRRWTRDRRLLRLPQEDCCQALSVPPTLKYQAEGGPGIRDILNLLKGSDDPEADQSTFLRAAIVFWLLGATDGHAKNFSIFLNPGGRFRLTPLYDVLSAQPSLDAGQIQHKQMKLAMSAGDKRHYRIDDIMPRHFLQTAEKAGIGVPVVQPILDDLRSTVPGAIERVVHSLPPGFPEQLVSSIVRGIESRLSRIEA
jgi:serine/threonine-protein kinase HipA